MGTEDKLYKKIQQAAENATPNTFPGMEKVWGRVEEKLETNVLKKEKNNWKKISVAASIIIALSILYNFSKKELQIEIEKDTIVVTDSIIKEKLESKERIVNNIRNIDTIKKVKKDSLIKLGGDKITFKVSQLVLVNTDSLKPDKENLKITLNNYVLGFIPAKDSTSSINKKATILFENLQKGNRKTEYTSFQSTSNQLTQNPKTLFKKPDPLVLINGNIKTISDLSGISNEEIDSIYVLKNPLYIINGAEYSEESLFGKNPASPYYPLDKQKIIATTILYKEEGEKLYGEKGKKGVVIIKTKNGKPNEKN